MIEAADRFRPSERAQAARRGAYKLHVVAHAARLVGQNVAHVAVMRTATTRTQPNNVRYRGYVLMIAAALLLLVVTVAPARAQSRRVALVIGNGAYHGGIPALPNPPNDATAFAGVIDRLGFTTLLMIDGTRNEMVAALQSFAVAAKGADVAIIYFSGHGVEVDGRNLLLPIDFTVTRDETRAAMFSQTVSLADIDAAMAATAAAVVLFIDACRNDPFAGATAGAASMRGIASIPGTASGLATQTVRSAAAVIYATGPGSVAFDGSGAYSPFTTALIQSLDQDVWNLAELVASVRSAVADATSGVQVPTPDRASIPTVSLLTAALKGSVQPTSIARFATLGRPAPAANKASSTGSSVSFWPFQGLPLVVQPLPPPFPFYCRAHAGRGWTKFPGGHATMAVSRDGLACAIQIYGYPELHIPAVNLVVAEPPRAGRVILRDNSFAYIPRPGFVGTDQFRIDADAVGRRREKMTGVVDVTVR